jgi:dethiobiotin synthetase
MHLKGIFITATDTDVGKTFVAAGIAAALNRRLGGQLVLGSKPKVSLWKPVQSGTHVGNPAADSYRLVMGSGLKQTEEETVSYTFAEPLAPWMAALREGAVIDFAALVREGLYRKRANDFVIVEGAGGLMVPLTEQHLMQNLAAALELPLLIIARPGLGTVNHTLLTIRAAQEQGLEVLGVILNGCSDLNAPWLKENVRMIETFGSIPVLGLLPWFEPEPQPVGLSSTQSDGKVTQDAETWRHWRERWSAIVDRELNSLFIALTDPNNNLNGGYTYDRNPKT